MQKQGLRPAFATGRVGFRRAFTAGDCATLSLLLAWDFSGLAETCQPL